MSLLIIGGNSIKTDGTKRTLAGFSATKLTGEKWYDIYVKYNGGDKLYANTFTSNACQGLAEFTSRSADPVITDISKSEACMKGSAYLNVWMYVIHELEEAIEDCQKSVTPSTHWDEALAFYTGSTTLVNSTKNYGVFTYGLAEKKCPLFKTCGVTGADRSLYKSTVNQKVFSLFASGSSYQKAGRCDNLVTTKEALVKQFTVPLLQGVMQYLYLSKTLNTEKPKAELWSFASALLPLISSYSPSVAKMLRKNAYILNPVTVPDGYMAVKASLESVYGAMGISCSDVGGWADKTTDSGYASGMDPCSDNNIVGYVSSSDVTQHLRLDLDQTEMQAFITNKLLLSAYKVYTTGEAARHA